MCEQEYGPMSLGCRVGRLVRHPSLLEGAVRSRLALRRFRRINLRQERERSLKFLAAGLGKDATPYFEELLTSEFRAGYERKKDELGSEYLYATGTTSDFDCETLYALVRSLRPRVVVETGVMLGASTAHILEALDRNGAGHLFSVDLPKKDEIGALVPKSLRERWTLQIGDARDVLPRLSSEIERVDLFHHDSLHTYDHQRWEFETASGLLGDHGVLTAHDVLHVRGFRDAFRRHAHRRNVRASVFFNLGIGLPAYRSGERRSTQSV